MAEQSNTTHLDALKNLPFVKDGDGCRNFWAPESTGEFRSNVRLGNEYGFALLRMAQSDAWIEPDLGWVLCAIAEGGALDDDEKGVLVGFGSVLSYALQEAARKPGFVDNLEKWDRQRSGGVDAIIGVAS